MMSLGRRVRSLEVEIQQEDRVSQEIEHFLREQQVIDTTYTYLDSLSFDGAFDIWLYAYWR